MYQRGQATLCWPQGIYIDTVVGIYIDADARMVTIVEHCDAAKSDGVIRMDDVPMPIKLVVQGPKHEIKATIMKDVVEPPLRRSGC